MPASIAVYVTPPPQLMSVTLPAAQWESESSRSTPDPTARELRQGCAARMAEGFRAREAGGAMEGSPASTSTGAQVNRATSHGYRRCIPAADTHSAEATRPTATGC